MNRLMKPLAIGKYLEFNTIWNRLMNRLMNLAIGKYLEFNTIMNRLDETPGHR